VFRVRRLRTLGFRNLVPDEAEVGDGITLAWGPNGAGKTNLLEALYLGLVGRSPSASLWLESRWTPSAPARRTRSSVR
jgi:DNA replication and repair protein RecF